MNPISRRSLLRVAALSPIGLSAACASLTNANIQKIIDDVTTIAGGVSAVLPAIGTINGISSTTVSAVGGIIADIRAVAAAIGSTVSTTTALPLVQRLEAGIGNIIGVLHGIALPNFVATILADAETLLPVVKTAVGLLVPASPSDDAVAAARLRLRAAAARS